MAGFLGRTVVGFALMFGAGAAMAAEPVSAYPSRVVKLVVGQAPGGTTDAIARAVATGLSQRWKQNVIVENVTGASGNLGAHTVARAAPDGYTLLMTYEGSQAMNPHVLPTTAFDAVKDFAPVATIAKAGFVLIAGPKTGIEDFKTLVARARAAPDTLTYGSSGAGSANHLIGEMLQSRSGIRLRHVPYRGASQSTTDVIAGQIDTAVVSLPSILGQLEAGTVKPLVITSAQRSSARPDVPSASEAGITGFDVTPWWGILAPAQTDPALVTKLATDINGLLDNEDFAASLRRQGADIFRSTPEAFGSLLEADIRKWGAVVKDIGLK